MNRIRRTCGRRLLLSVVLAGVLIAPMALSSASAATEPSDPSAVQPHPIAMPTADVLDQGVARAAAPRRAVAGEVFPGPGSPLVPIDVPTALPFDFRTSGFRPATDIPDRLRPWRTGVAPRIDTGPHDATGVRMFRLNGQLVDHPVGQIQYGLQNLSTARAAGNPSDRQFFLDRAMKQANRLIDNRMVARDAWWWPYSFAYSIGGHDGISYGPNWVSGMSQGESLSLFSQLANFKDVPEASRANYRLAADGAFASLFRGPETRSDPSQPWVAHVDSDGHLWIQEYPQSDPTKSDFTYNGFMFALFGLWDYHLATGNELAAQMFDGGLTTIRSAFPEIRNKGWYSSYCVQHRIFSKGYHTIHIFQLTQMHALTKNPLFAAMADVLLDDAPPNVLSASARVQFVRGKHVFRMFSTTGAVTRTKTVRMSRDTIEAASERTRIINRGGIYYRITSGALKGWYATESYPRVYLRGQWVTQNYAPGRTATFKAGNRFAAYAFSASGGVARRRYFSSPRASVMAFDSRAVINGQTLIRLSSGPNAGMWVLQSPAVVTDQP